MKRFTLSLFLVLCLGGRAAAGPDPVYINNFILTTRTNIDATVFINQRLIFFDLLSLGTVDSVMFQTKDTLYYTNTSIATMVAQPGFVFNTSTSRGVHSAATFNNAGSILSLDAQAQTFIAVTGGTVPILLPAQSSAPGQNVPVPGGIVVSATNIDISGTMSVGDLGLMQLNGSTLHLSGALAAGFLSELDTNYTMGRGIEIGYTGGAPVYPFFAPAAEVYDIAWGATNGASSSNNVIILADDMLVASLSSNAPVIDLPYPTLGSRNGTLQGLLLRSLIAPGFVPYDIFPISSLLPQPQSTPTVTTPPAAPNFKFYVYDFVTLSTSNGVEYYYNIVLLNTGFADSNITAQVAFGYSDNIVTNVDFGLNPMVRFSCPVYDVTTGQTVSNSIYLIDTGASQPAVEAVSSIYPFDDRPLPFEITRSQPAEWPFAYPANDLFNPAILYAAGQFKNVTVPMTNAFYVAQVGRYPESLQGLFDYTATLLGTTQVGMPDPTNEGGRLEITAKTGIVTGLNFRANGFVKMNCPALVGTPAGADFGNMQLDLGALNSPLLISNLLPSAFHRLRGDIAVYSATWMNTQTNDGLGTNAIDKVTNNFHYHLLIVDQDLRSGFEPAATDIALRGSAVVLDDPMAVMRSALFQTTNLTLNANLHLTGAANTLQPVNVPLMKNLLIGSGGSIVADNFINLNVVTGLTPVNPTRQNTPILSITNLGLITSQETEIQSQIFANGGTVAATNNGAIILSAITNFLGAGALGLTNTLAADSDITLTSTSIQATNSTILAGQAMPGGLILSVGSELTDHYPGAPSTNVYRTNLWQVTGGFSLAGKPARGDLLGTQIKTIANVTKLTINHLWAGQDLGPTAAGFTDNAAIGHLILDRTTNGTLRFSAAGRKNAMYVDYLELQDLSLSDYHNGLVVDPNFAIYFANANVDPIKLARVYTNIVWVPQFTGPNSTAYVKVTSPSGAGTVTNTVPMNAALKNSGSISSANNGIVNANNPFPLNNPNAGPYPIPSPSLVTWATNVPVSNSIGVSGQTFEIFATGQGSIKANVSLSGLRAGQTLTLTAAPSNNWFFKGWSWPVAASPTNVTNSTITFQVPTNAFSFVTANFVTNPYGPLAGVYSGLFYPTNGVTEASSGFVSVTIASNSMGVYTAKLLLDGGSNSFSGSFDVTGTARATLARSSKTPVSVTLSVDLNPANALMGGTVSNAAAGWNSVIQADRAVFSATANPATNYAGQFTLLLPPGTNAPVGSPDGYGYAAITNTLGGISTLGGALADGTPLLLSAPIARNGGIPLYQSLYSGKGSLIGWLYITNQPPQIVSTNSSVSWIKPSISNTLYPSGFTNLILTGVLGSPYTNTAKAGAPVLNLTQATLILTNGNLTNGCLIYTNIGTNLASRNTLTNLNAGNTSLSPTNHLVIAINTNNGLVTVTFQATRAKTNTIAHGAVLQNQTNAAGYFLGTNQSGAFLLGNP